MSKVIWKGGSATLYEAQVDVIRNHVIGSNVYDLGAGCLALSKKLLELGAEKVVAVDKEFPLKPGIVAKGNQLHIWRAYFVDIADVAIDVAMLSWPPNYDCRLVPVLRNCWRIIYLGSNTEGNACGTPKMFDYLRSRSVLAYIPRRENTLIVYGDPVLTPRQLFHEEEAAFSTEVILPFIEEEDIL